MLIGLPGTGHRWIALSAPPPFPPHLLNNWRQVWKRVWISEVRAQLFERRLTLSTESISIHWIGQFTFWAQLFECRLALTLGLNFNPVYLFIKSNFSSFFSLIYILVLLIRWSKFHQRHDQSEALPGSGQWHVMSIDIMALGIEFLHSWNADCFLRLQKNPLSLFVP